MSKYCTLYSKENAVKPLNENYLEKKRRREENRNSTGPKWFNNDIDVNNTGRNIFCKNNGINKLNEFIDKIGDNEMIDKINEDNNYKTEE